MILDEKKVIFPTENFTSTSCFN